MPAKAKKTKLNTVGLKELRENMETYIEKVAQGETVLVFRRSKPLFRLTPIDEEEMGWETVIDFTEIEPNGVPIEEVLASLRKMNGQG
jgi:prevent-host-death family protein